MEGAHLRRLSEAEQEILETGWGRIKRRVRDDQSLSVCTREGNGDDNIRRDEKGVNLRKKIEMPLGQIFRG